jgi:group I intron endonuclease
MTIGLYKITLKINGMCYIGSSINIEKRFKQHLSLLNNNHHTNIYLQRAWNKYGKDNFIFEIIESCEDISREDLFKKEEFLLNSSELKLFNLTKLASGGDIINNHPDKDKILKKIYIKLLERYLKMSEEERNVLSESRKGAHNPMYGKHHTDATKNKISLKISDFYKNNISTLKNKSFEERFGKEKAAELKANLSNNASKRIGDKNPFWNKTHSKESKEKISRANLGKKNESQCKPMIINDVVYTSLAEASRILNIPLATVRWRALSKNIKFINYSYIVLPEK